MIKCEMTQDGLIKHYSDKDVLIIQNETGLLYVSAVDCVPCRYTYSESNEKLPEKPKGAEQ